MDYKIVHDVFYNKPWVVLNYRNAIIALYRTLEDAKHAYPKAIVTWMEN
jgi:hypothetical protein